MVAILLTFYLDAFYWQKVFIFGQNITEMCSYKCNWQLSHLWFRYWIGAEQLTHWGRVTHICVGTNTNIGSDNGLSPGRRQAIIWTNARILLIGPQCVNKLLTTQCTDVLKPHTLQGIMILGNFSRSLRLFLLKLINFNPSMDMWLHAL